MKFYPEIQKKIEKLSTAEISAVRKQVLQPLIDFIQNSKDSGEKIQLNFICTHNSRRSQFGQIWAQAISAYYEIETYCFSGGTEETAFYNNAIQALERAGFRIVPASGSNPRYEVNYAEDAPPMICFSKVYDSPENPAENFAALMTCNHADDNCPFIPGSKARIALDYKDPKQFDGTPLANAKYDERSDQIAAEMIYVFNSIT